MLVSMGFESVAASGGEEGLALLHASLRPDLVISDVEMPRIEGIELFKTIQQDSELGRVPWMFMSSSGRKNYAFEAGCAHFLARPFTLHDLKQAVSGIL